jgi:hypothetical protein
MQRFAHSRASALPLAFEAPQDASLIQPTIEAADAIEAAKIVALTILAITRMLSFYASCVGITGDVREIIRQP